MKKVNEENLKNRLPQLQLNESVKERIHTAILHQCPSPQSKKSLWKESKWSSLVAAAVGIFVFSLLTVYIISETERNQEHELYIQAEGEIQAVYKEMEGYLQKTAEGKLLNPIEESKMKSAQLSLKKVKTASGSEKEKNKLISMMGEIEIYNQTVPAANELQTQIDDVNRMLSQNVFDKDFEKKISALKNGVEKKGKNVDLVKNVPLKAFFSKQYPPQVETLEKEFKKYMDVQEEVQMLKKMAMEQSVKGEDFEAKAENVMIRIKDLPNKQMAVMMEDEINIAKAKFQQFRVDAEEEKKRVEEERVSQKRSEETPSKPKEMNTGSSVSGEKEEPRSETSSPEDELYPLEFTMTDSNGFTFKLSRDFDKYKKGKGYDDIARRYGGRYYYTPNSDMSHVIIGRKIIATVSLVSGADVEYKDLFIDLMTYQSKKYTREQFASIVETVIQSGEPYKVEEGDSGELLKVENGALIYDSW